MVRSSASKIRFLVFLAAGLVSSWNSLAAQEVTLLTSLGSENQADVFVLEKIFREHFEPKGVRIGIYHQADQYQLWTLLHSPRHIALFWVSHGNCALGPVKIAGNQGRVVDTSGVDVLNLFQEIHPNFRYLAVIACGSQKVAESLSGRVSPFLKVKTFKGSVIASLGLQEALEESDASLESDEVRRGYPCHPCPVRRGIPIQVSRTARDSQQDLLPALRIENQRKVLGVLPQQELGSEDPVLHTYLPMPPRLTPLAALDVSLKPAIRSDLIQISMGAQHIWKPWGDFESKSPSLTTLFSYGGSFDQESFQKQEVEYTPFSCEEMSSR